MYKRLFNLKKINRDNINVPEIYILNYTIATGCYLGKPIKYYFGQHFLKDK